MSLDYRMDKDAGNKPAYRARMKLGHAKERIISVAYRIQLERRYGAPFTVINRGVGNDGEIIDGPLPHNNADFGYIGLGMQINVEVKTSPDYQTYFNDFKETSLKSCIDDNAVILYYAMSHPEHYRTIHPRMMLRILKVFEPKCYPNGLAPGKPCSRLRPSNEPLYLGEYHRWHPEAQAVLDHYRDYLNMSTN